MIYLSIFYCFVIVLEIGNWGMQKNRNRLRGSGDNWVQEDGKKAYLVKENMLCMSVPK